MDTLFGMLDELERETRPLMEAGARLGRVGAVHGVGAPGHASAGGAGGGPQPGAGRDSQPVSHSVPEMQLALAVTDAHSAANPRRRRRPRSPQGAGGAQGRGRDAALEHWLRAGGGGGEGDGPVPALLRRGGRVSAARGRCRCCPRSCLPVCSRMPCPLPTLASLGPPQLGPHLCRAGHPLPWRHHGAGPVSLVVVVLLLLLLHTPDRACSCSLRAGAAGRGTRAPATLPSRARPSSRRLWLPTAPCLYCPRHRRSRGRRCDREGKYSNGFCHVRALLGGRLWGLVSATAL